MTTMTHEHTKPVHTQGDVDMTLNTTAKPDAATLTACENFHDKLTWWHQIGDDEEGANHARLNLIQACGALWNNKASIPEPFRHEIRDAIGNWKDADDWEAKGRSYSVAARLISARLKAQEAA